MTMPVSELLEHRRLLVVAGAGGVGKTSTAAALGLAAAQRGRRVGVLTVDPAPRLGDALGIDELSDRAQAVELDSIPRNGACLHAMRLDAKRTFDRMVERFAPDRDSAEALLENPVYQRVAGSLGGSEHYMAFQRLYELVGEDDHDLLIVDTPPAANASELFSAPLRLSDLIDTGAASLLAEPSRLLARAGSTLARASFALVLAVLQRVVGSETQRQVSEFAEMFAHLLEGLEIRVREVDALLKSPHTAFILIARPDPDEVDAVLNFHAALHRNEVKPQLLIANRLTPPPGHEREQAAAQRLRGAPRGTLAVVEHMEAELDSCRAREEQALAELRSILEPMDTPVVAIPSLAGDISSLSDVETLAAQFD